MAKILIVEDEPDIRDLVAFTLRYGGFEVVTANNGAEAVDASLAEMPDLVLMDVRMPVMTGFEACEKIKSTPQTANIPVVFLSAKGQEAEIRQGFEIGALDYLLKPFDPLELLQRVRDLVGNHHDPAGGI